MELIINLPSAFGIPLLLLVLPVAPAISVSPRLSLPPSASSPEVGSEAIQPPPPLLLLFSTSPLSPSFFLSSPSIPFSFSPLPSLLCHSISVRVGETRYRERGRRGGSRKELFCFDIGFPFL